MLNKSIDIPTDNLFASPIFAQDIKQRFQDNLMIVSPDVGGVVRARKLSNRVNGQLAIVDKRRPRAGQSEVMNIIGNVEGYHCLLIDDIVDSAGTLCNAASALLQNGAKSVSAYITHGVLSGEAINRVNKSNLEKLFVTDSICPNKNIINNPKFGIISIANLIGEAMKRISEENSVSDLFD